MNAEDCLSHLKWIAEPMMRTSKSSAEVVSVNAERVVSPTFPCRILSSIRSAMDWVEPWAES